MKKFLVFFIMTKTAATLTNATLPRSLTAIGRRVFASCFSLTAIVLPGSMTSISASSFGLCDCPTGSP